MKRETIDAYLVIKKMYLFQLCFFFFSLHDTIMQRKRRSYKRVFVFGITVKEERRRERKEGIDFPLFCLFLFLLLRAFQDLDFLSR